MSSEHAPELDATDARQARWGRHAFVILVTSLTLVIIAFAAVYLTHAGAFAGRNGNREAPAAVARATNTPPGVVRQSETTAPPAG